MKLPLVGERPKARLKQSPQDFVVRELHDLKPLSRGPFWLVEVTKCDLPTPVLLRQIADYFQVERSSVACAGYKDRCAVTTQWLTLPAPLASRKAPPLEHLVEWKPLGFLEQALRPGNLRANQFRIRLEGLPADYRLEPAWQAQLPLGWANYYGIQRFGSDNHNWQEGLNQLRQPPPRRQCRRWPNNYAISSVQSQLFNQFVEMRLQEDRFLALPGDWVLTAEGERLWESGLEGLPLGPIWGYKLLEPSQDELRVLQSVGLTAHSFYPFRAPGSRRPICLKLPPIRQDRDWFEFELPPGCYATVLLEHFFDLS